MEKLFHVEERGKGEQKLEKNKMCVGTKIVMFFVFF